MKEQERLALIKHCEMVRDGETFFDSITEFNKRHQQLNEIALSVLQSKTAMPELPATDWMPYWVDKRRLDLPLMKHSRDGKAKVTFLCPTGITIYDRGTYGMGLTPVPCFLCGREHLVFQFDEDWRREIVRLSPINPPED